MERKAQTPHKAPFPSVRVLAHGAAIQSCHESPASCAWIAIQGHAAQICQVFFCSRNKLLNPSKQAHQHVFSFGKLQCFSLSELMGNTADHAKMTAMVVFFVFMLTQNCACMYCASSWAMLSFSNWKAFSGLCREAISFTSWHNYSRPSPASTPGLQSRPSSPRGTKSKPSRSSCTSNSNHLVARLGTRKKGHLTWRVLRIYKVLRSISCTKRPLQSLTEGWICFQASAHTQIRSKNQIPPARSTPASARLQGSVKSCLWLWNHHLLTQVREALLMSWTEGPEKVRGGLCSMPTGFWQLTRSRTSKSGMHVTSTPINKLSVIPILLRRRGKQAIVGLSNLLWSLWNFARTPWVFVNDDTFHISEFVFCIRLWPPCDLSIWMKLLKRKTNTNVGMLNPAYMPAESFLMAVILCLCRDNHRYGTAPNAAIADQIISLSASKEVQIDIAYQIASDLMMREVNVSLDSLQVHRLCLRKLYLTL